MEEKEILTFFIKNGLLIEPSLLKKFTKIQDTELIKSLVELLKKEVNSKIITEEVLKKNQEKLSKIFEESEGVYKESLEKVKITLGFEIELSKKRIEIEKRQEPLEKKDSSRVLIYNPLYKTKKKISIEDFTNLFKDRFLEIKNILQNKPELENLISINKVSSLRKQSIIGLVSEKRITQNNNVLLELEDQTGKIKVLVNQSKQEAYQKALDVSLDSVIGIVGSGNKEFFFANDIVFPDAFLQERKKSPKEEYALFISDIHFGSKLFMKENFLNFIDFLNGKTPSNIDTSKIKYLFIVGDIVAGIGVYPNQEKDLEILDLEDQFKGFAELLSNIRRDINIIISPGNHDGVRLMEPQPPLDEKYSWPLYNLRNVYLVSNPSYVNISSSESFSGFDVLIYHGFSYPFYASTVPSLMEGGLNSPEKIMAYLLKNRHLSPTYSSTQIFPLEKDELIIKKIPDIFVSGHTHKCAVHNYNNILLISGGTWEKETEYQKRKGNKPDFCKVPMLNLKSGSVKVLDFE
ncbi:MAG: hypothetical protein KatS3mg001_347 [Candidatus Pacearchaeota archaeon]|nr:MAG: hypothetical protein KatS3mg001_347 [Candidatus Pacearchaeota archaeon]